MNRHDEEEKSITRTTEATPADKDAAAVIQEESAILARVEHGQILPASRAEQNKIGEIVARNVHNRFGESLSPSDRTLWMSFNSGAPLRTDLRVANDRTRLYDAYNDHVLASVFHYGLALLLDPDMMRLVSSWESLRPDLMKRLYKQLERRTKTLRGEKPAPITKEHADLKRKAVPELRRLFRKFQRQSPRGTVTNTQLADFIKAERQTHPESWPKMLPYLAELESFIRDWKQPLATLILNSSITAPTFIDEWFAVTHGVTVPYAGQKLAGRLK